MIPDLEDGVAYTSFLNDLKSGWFKFSLAQQKETTLMEALRKIVNFICATEICAEGVDAPKKTKVPIDRNLGCGDRRPHLEGIDPLFAMDPRSIVMEVRGHPMLKMPPPMTSAPKPTMRGSTMSSMSRVGTRPPNARS